MPKWRLPGSDNCNTGQCQDVATESTPFVESTPIYEDGQYLSPSIPTEPMPYDSGMIDGQVIDGEVISGPIMNGGVINSQIVENGPIQGGTVVSPGISIPPSPSHFSFGNEVVSPSSTRAVTVTGPELAPVPTN